MAFVRHALKRTACLVGLMVVFGCSSSYRVPQSTRGPTVTLVDSIQLMVPDSIPLGGLLHAARWAARSYLVHDIDRFRILVFDARGQLVRIFPTRTTGFNDHGGESSAPYVLPGDTVVAVHDWWQKAFRAYRISDGHKVAEIRAEILRVAPQYSARGDTLYFGTVVPQGSGPAVFPGPVARWIVGLGSIASIGTSPTPLRHNVVVWVTHGYSGVVVHDNGLVVVLGSEAGLRVLDSLGVERRRVLIPAARRRGTPPGLFRRAIVPKTTQWRQLLGSKLRTLSARPSGELVLTYLDFDQIVPDSLSNVDAFDGRFHDYVSVISSDLSRVCLDGEVPADPAEGASVLWRGDTLERLSRVSPGLQTKPLIIRRFRLNTDQCDWVPTGDWRP